MAKKTKKEYRSSKTGQMVSADFGKKHPSTTEWETIPMKLPVRKKKK
ncbi:MAG: hypothetical protein ABR875_00320 [Minisyncoccia bacterium]